MTVVGEGNVVNTSFTDLSRALTELRTAVLSADDISDAEKLNVAADIDALQSQLQKPDPDRNVIAALWRGVEGAASVGGAAALARILHEPAAPPFCGGAVLSG